LDGSANRFGGKTNHAASFHATIGQEIMRMIAVLQTDCPTCQLIIPYLNRLAASGVPLTGISQDAAGDTADFVRRMEVAFALDLDPGYRKSVSL
jgi:hypothetical protein